MTFEKERTPRSLLGKGVIDRYMDARPEWKNADALCVYGSYYNGDWRLGKSDIDLIRIIPDITGMERTNDVFEDIPVNSYTISMETLAADALHADSGYWYINRFLTPHYFVADKGRNKERIYELVAKFLEQYALPEAFSDQKSHTIDEIIARTYLVQLNDFPHYALGFLSIFRKHSFLQLREQFAAFFAKSSQINGNEGPYSYSGSIGKENRALYHEKIRLLRWEAHRKSRKDGMDPEFVSKYLLPIEKEAAERKTEIDDLMTFLRESAKV